MTNGKYNKIDTSRFKSKIEEDESMLSVLPGILFIALIIFGVKSCVGWLDIDWQYHKETIESIGTCDQGQALGPSYSCIVKTKEGNIHRVYRPVIVGEVLTIKCHPKPDEDRCFDI